MATRSRSKINTSLMAAGCVFLLASVQEVRAEANRVDAATFKGYQVYKRQRCETCHGQDANGSASFPSLVAALKTKSREDFVNIVLEGKGAMPAHKNNRAVADNIDALYAYVKARSDGTVPAGGLEEIK